MVPATVAKGGEWGFSSSGVNRIEASVEVGDQTWLGTDCGIKLLNNKTETVTHYTKMDGLPYYKTPAIYADSEGAFCIQTNARLFRYDFLSTSALCAFDKKTHRWRTLTEVASLYDDSAHSIYTNQSRYERYPYDGFFIALCPERVCFIARPLVNNSAIFAHCYDRRTGILEEIPAEKSFRSFIPYLKVTWVNVDRESVWFGTNHGLWRWSFLEKKWEHWLKDMIIFAGVKDLEGVFRLAVFDAASQINSSGERQRPGADALARSSLDTWKLISFNQYSIASGMEKVAVLPQLILPKNEEGSQTEISVEKLIPYNGKVWLRLTGSKYLSYSPEENRFDSDYLRPTRKNGDGMRIEGVPDFVLYGGESAGKPFTYKQFMKRYQSQYCEVGEDFFPPRQDVKEYLIGDPDGSKWSTVGTQLNHYSQSGVKIESFQLANERFPALVPVTAMATLGDVLYTFSGRDLNSYDPRTKQWKSIPVPVDGQTRYNRSGYHGRFAYPRSLFVVGNSLLITIGYSTYRYYPETKLLHSESLRYPGANEGDGNLSSSGGDRNTKRPSGYMYDDEILGTEDDAIWITNKSREKLWRADLSTQLRSEHPFPKLPETLSGRGFDTIFPVTFVQGTLFFQLINSKLQESLLIGYEPNTGYWTNGLSFKSVGRASCNSLTKDGKSYLGLISAAHAIYEYNPKNRELGLTFKFVEAGNDLPNLTFISIDEREIGVHYANSNSLHLIDRETNQLKHFDMPEGLGNRSLSGGAMLKVGTDYHLQTPYGVWRLAHTSKTWELLPGIPTRLEFAYVRSVDSKSIWLSGESFDSNFGQSIVQFNKTSAKCKLWAIATGTQPGIQWRQISSDRVSAWALSDDNPFYGSPDYDQINPSPHNELFHLDLKKNEWVNVSKKFGRANEPMQFKLVKPDADSVWLLVGMPYSYSHGSYPVQNPLYRYDFSTGKYSVLNPLPGVYPTYTGLQVDPKSALLIGNTGVYRYAKSSLKWSKVEPPSEARRFCDFPVERVESSGSNLIFVDKDWVLKFKEPK